MPPVRLVRWLAAVLAAWLVAHEVHVLVPGLEGVGGPVFGRWIHVIVMAVGALAVIARAVTAKEERLGWLLVGGALLAWTAGEAYFTLVLWDLASPPVPSPADVGYLLFPILALAGFVALACARVRGANRLMAADAAIAALAAGAVSAALVFGAVAGAVGGGDDLAIATNLAYPVADLLLLATIVGIGGLQRWRVNRTWLLLAAGCLLFTVTDGVYLVEVARGTWVSGGPWDAGWWAAAPLWAIAAWTPVSTRSARGGDDPLGPRPAPARIRRGRARRPRRGGGPSGQRARRRARRGRARGEHPAPALHAARAHREPAPRARRGDDRRAHRPGQPPAAGHRPRPALRRAARGGRAHARRLRPRRLQALQRRLRPPGRRRRPRASGGPSARQRGPRRPRLPSRWRRVLRAARAGRGGVAGAACGLQRRALRGG